MVFFLLDSLAKGDTSRLEAVAEEAGMDPFYINKYRDLMKYAAGTPPSERFETTHGFYMAVVQGFSASIIMCGDCRFFHGGGVPADGKVYHAMEGYSS